MRRDGEAGVGMVADHAFVPRAEWWTVCRVCGLGEAAHMETTVERDDDGTHPDI